MSGQPEFQGGSRREAPGARTGDGYIPDAGACAACSKWRYFNRKGAKRAAKKFHPGDRLSVYPCPADPAYWHFGHLPGAVRRGTASRDQIRNQRRSP